MTTQHSNLQPDSHLQTPMTTTSKADVSWRPDVRSEHLPEQPTLPQKDPSVQPIFTTRPTRAHGTASQQSAAPPILRSGRRTILVVPFGIAVLICGALALNALSNRQSEMGMYLVITVLCALGLRWALAGGQYFVGEVRGYQERSEPNGNIPWVVRSFRVESYDESGNRLPPIPVEMRGLSFRGAIVEGDWVAVRGYRRTGSTQRVRHLYNQTTGAVVSAKGMPLWMIVGTLAFYAVVILICALFFAVVSRSHM